MDYLACPRCGSLYFLSSRSPDRLVFQADTEKNLWLAQADQLAASRAAISPHHIFCGACSWQGTVDELTVSLT